MSIAFNPSEASARDTAGCSNKSFHDQTPSLLQRLVASLLNPMGTQSMMLASMQSPFAPLSRTQLNTALPYSQAIDTTGFSNQFDGLPADAFEPVPIGGNNTRTSAPSMDASRLETVLEHSLGLMSHSDSFSNVRKASLPPTATMVPVPKRRRVSSNQQPRFRGYQEKQWEEQFDELLKFKEEQGHCLVPHTYTENQVLSRWVKRQRYQYKLMSAGKVPSTMTHARIKKLEDIGFAWNSHATAWHKRLQELSQYCEKHGDCNVPSNYPENPELATWIKCQRRQHKLFWAGNKASSMTVERMDALNEVGFLWKVREDLLPLPSASLVF